MTSTSEYQATAQQAAKAYIRQSDGTLRVRVVSNSMSPWLRAGDQVQVTACKPEDVTPGDLLVVIGNDNTWQTHRFVCLTPQGLVLKGDANPWCDPPVPPAHLIGRVSGVWRGATFHPWTALCNARATNWALLHARLTLGQQPSLALRGLARFFRLGHRILWKGKM